VLYRFRQSLALRRYNRAVRPVLNTPPVSCDPDAGAAFATQLCHRDVLMYLCALKSLQRFVPARAILILDDGSLTPEDHAILRAHVPDIETVALESVENRRCPPGGCWERLLLIAERVRDHYVVQLDADTLTVAEPTEVIDAIAANRSFTLGTSMGREFMGLREAAERAEGFYKGPDDHIQTLTEMAFAKLPNADSGRYVRGCAGFAGFRKGPSLREDVETLSQTMAELVPNERWSDWGSEQVTSNYIVSNTENPVVLPFPKYGHYHPEADLEQAAFLHFIGTYRFTQGTYARLARAELLQAPSA